MLSVNVKNLYFNDLKTSSALIKMFDYELN